MNTCGAKTKSGTLCKRAPVEGGKRCKLHGGASLRGTEHPNFKSGRYTNYLSESISSKLVDFEAHDPLDLLPELQVQRALFAEYTGKFKETGKFEVADVDNLMRWAAEIGRMVERIVKMRNETALTAAEVAFIAARIPDVVTRFIDDPDKQRRFIAELFGIVRGASAGGSEARRITSSANRS